MVFSRRRGGPPPVKHPRTQHHNASVLGRLSSDVVGVEECNGNLRVWFPPRSLFVTRREYSVGIDESPATRVFHYINRASKVQYVRVGTSMKGCSWSTPQGVPEEACGGPVVCCSRVPRFFFLLQVQLIN